MAKLEAATPTTGALPPSARSGAAGCQRCIGARVGHHCARRRVPSHGLGNALCAQADGRLRPDERDDRRRPQGRARAGARLRRDRAAAGVGEGPRQFRHRRRPPLRGDHLQGAVEGQARLRLPDGGAGPGRGPRQDASLDRRPARRHHQLPARHPALLHRHRRWSARARSSAASSTIRSWTSSTRPRRARAPSSTAGACAWRPARPWRTP